MGFRPTETHGRSFYGYIRRRGRRIDRSNLSKCAFFFFFRIGRVTAASRNGRTRPRRKRSPADYVCSVTTSRRSSDKRSAVSRATYHAGSKSVRRRDSPLLRALLRPAPAVFSTFLDGRLLLRSAVSPFIEAVYRSVRLIRLGLPCPSVCLTYFCFSEDSRLFIFRYSRSLSLSLAGNASSSCVVVLLFHVAAGRRVFPAKDFSFRGQVEDRRWRLQSFLRIRTSLHRGKKKDF